MTLTIVPGAPPTDHVADGSLHQEERRPQVDRDVLVEELGRGVEQRATAGEAGRVDEAVDRPNRRTTSSHGRLRLPDVGDVGSDVRRRAPAPVLELRGEGLSDVARDGR